MSHAPAVACTVRRSPFAGALTLALWLSGAALAAHAATHADGMPGSGWRLVVLGCTLVGCGAFAVAQWLQAPQGMLRWDGQGWWWQPHGGDDRAGTLSLRLDLQRRLLVRWSDPVDSQVRWFWLHTNSAGHAADWHALRCALHVRPRALHQEAQTDDRTRAAIPAGTPS